METFIRLFIVLALIGTSVSSVFAQQNFAHDLRNAGHSARVVTLPTEPGRMETYFINIKDNDAVRSPFRVIFGLNGMGVAPAGVKKEGTGHHHLLIDTAMPLDLTLPIPFSNKYHHFGAGQTETVLDLPPGKHSLQLLFADQDHRPLHKTKHGTEIVIHSKKITITVEEPLSASKH